MDEKAILEAHRNFVDGLMRRFNSKAAEARSKLVAARDSHSKRETKKLLTEFIDINFPRFSFKTADRMRRHLQEMKELYEKSKSISKEISDLEQLETETGMDETHSWRDCDTPDGVIASPATLNDFDETIYSEDSE